MGYPVLATSLTIFTQRIKETRPQGKRLILCGDPYQLPPTIKSSGAAKKALGMLLKRFGGVPLVVHALTDCPVWSTPPDRTHKQSRPCLIALLVGARTPLSKCSLSSTA